MALSQHTAPGGAAAFSYQFERALLWLAKSPSGSCIGIETDDDVSVLYVEGAKLLEQDKHTIQGVATFGDRSKDLWNTLAIWVTAIENRELPDNTAFRMVTNAVLSSGIAAAISHARSDSEIDLCVEALKRAGADPATGIAQMVGTVLAPSALHALRTVIRNCELLDGSERAAGAALRQETIAHLQLRQSDAIQADSIVDELLGWLHKEVLLLWQSGKPGWVQRDHFVNCLSAVVDRRRRQKTRERAEFLVPVSESDIGQKRASNFVRQLYLITDDNATVDNAIKDFVRCSIEKIRLSAEGEITDADWLAFEQTLIRRWVAISGRVVRLSKYSDARDVGFEVFSETTEEHRERLAGAETDHVYLTSGSYHALAEELTVGWHPQFNTLLKKN